MDHSETLTTEWHDQGDAETQLVTFMLAEEEFGIPSFCVKEIVQVPEITRVPQVPAFVEGLANLRGSILPIINLRRRFDLPAHELTDDSRVVVIETGGRLTGLIADEVSEVMHVSHDRIEPPPDAVGAAVGADYLNGIVKLQEGKRLVLLLDIEKILPSVAVTAAPSRLAGTATDSRRADRQLGDHEQVVSFRIAAEEYAIAITEVQEIIRVPEISRVPNAPDDIEGVVALRDRLLPIVNLRKRFRQPDVERDDDSRIIVVNVGGMTAGILVDAVSEVLSVPRHAIEPPPRIVDPDGRGELYGIARLDGGSRLITLLNAGRLLADSPLQQVAADAAESGGGTDAVEERNRRQALDEEQFVSFRLGSQEFGVNIQQVQEIIWLTTITRIPRAPHFVEGIVNLRGEVLPVIDMRKRFGFAPAPVTDSSSIVVVNVNGQRTGMIVDAVSEVLRLSRAAIEPPPPIIREVDVGMVQGVGKLEEGQRMIIILALERVLSLEG
jgi:purine-binding chemotaxis protein CheW